VGVLFSPPPPPFTAHPETTDDLGAVAGADVVFVGLKAYSLPEIAPRLGPLLKPGVAAIWAQNGIPWWYQPDLESVDPGGVIAKSIPSEHNVGCVVYCSTEIIEPGVIKHIEGTRFTLGEPDGSASDRCQAISAAFKAGGLRAPVEPRLADQIWLKLTGNVAFNPVTALTRATLGQLGTEPAMVDLLRSIFEECAAVADRFGVRFPVSLDRRLEAGLAVGEHKTSMLQDLERGRPMEIDALLGAVVELGESVGQEMPTCRNVLALVRERARQAGCY
jgi:2-dehydropantoate 2-reductase